MPLSAHFSDPDGEPLFYRIVAYSPDYFSAILLDGVLRIKALKNGYGTVTVSAMDALGESVETEVPILVRNPSSNLSLLPGTVVTNSLTVLPGLAPGPVSVRLLTTTGSVVYSVSGTYSVLDPIVIDLSRVAPGLYSLLVTQGGQTSKQTIVKK